MKSGIKLLCAFVMISLFTKAQNPNYTITHNNVTREYWLHLPTNFVTSDTLPLVFCLHGLNQSPKRISEVSGFDTIADRDHFVVVYPMGIDTVWNTFSNPYHSGADDCNFISALIDTLRKDYHINLNRVYATGMSNGGFLSYKLACELSDRIAAIAPLAGAFTDSMKYYCHPNRPMPVLDIHGTSDFVVGYTAGIANIPVQATLDYWTNYNHCPATSTSTNLPNTNTQDNCTVTKIEWTPCDGTSEVVHYKIVGGGHTWPGSSVTFGGLGGNTNYDIDASEIIWEFFNRYNLQGLINGVNDIHAKPVVRVYPNPANDIVTVDFGEAIPNEIQLRDLSGKILSERKLLRSEITTQLSLNNLAAGVYVVYWSSLQTSGVTRVIKL